MSDEEKKAIEYFKEKIKNKLPLYEETYIDGKPYRRNILQLETNFTEEQANKTKILLNLIKKQQKEIEQLKNADLTTVYISGVYDGEKKVEDKIKAKIEELDKAYEDSKNEDGESEYYYPNYTIEVLQSLLEKE